MSGERFPAWKAGMSEQEQRDPCLPLQPCSEAAFPGHRPWWGSSSCSAQAPVKVTAASPNRHR